MTSMFKNQLYIKQGVFQQKHTENKVMYWSVDESVTEGSQEPSPILPLGPLVQYLLI